MKNTIMALVAAVTMGAFGSTDIYEFKTTIKYPTVGKTAFVGASTKVSGFLTITDAGTTNATAELEVVVKKTGAAYTFSITNAEELAVFGKKGTDCAQTIHFVNKDQSEGLVEFTFGGWGAIKTKTTGGCTPCGDTTSSCSRMTKLSGVVIGKYICPCGGKFQAWDGGCDIDPEDEVEAMTVYGSSAKFTLKTVDGSKWK